MPDSSNPILPQYVAENVLTLLCLSKEHGRLVASLVTADQFDDDVYKTVAIRALAYWRKHRRPPGKVHVADLLSDILEDKNNRRRARFRAVIDGMLLADYEGINTQYVVDSVKTLHRLSALTKATIRAANLLERNEPQSIEEVEKVWNEVLSARILHFDPGLKLSDYPRALKYLEGRKEEFVTGIKPFDRAGIVPARGTVFLFLAPSGFGKTWFVINVGRRAVQERKKVLHLTLELEADQVLVRYLQSLFGVPEYRGEKKLYSMRIKRSEVGGHFGGGIGALKRRIKPAFALADRKAPGQIATKLEWYGRRIENLIVKQFPMRRLNMNDLAGYLDSLEQVEKFVPDLVVLDYFGVVRTDPKDHRVSLGREFEEFRALMVERNMAGLTAQQVNRKGMEARDVRATHAAEDISLINTSDIAITMSATPQEREKHLARLQVSKARAVRDQFGALITQNYDTGQFCVDSMRLDEAYWSWLRGKKDGEGDDDDADAEDGEAAG